MNPSLLKKSFCSVYGLTYLYLSSSVIIFLLGFFKLWIGIPISLLLLCAVGKSIYNAPEQRIPFRFSNFKWIAVIGTIFLWVIVSGIGGYMPQTFDHIFRNVIFTDLIQYNWPIVRGDAVFVYYIGFWLPSALVGKLFGIEAGFAFQAIWAAIGITLTFVMLCEYLEKFRYWFLLVFIFWGGTVLCPCYPLIKEVTAENNSLNIKTLWYVICDQRSFSLLGMQIPRNIILMRWVHNQGIPFWVGFMLILNLLKFKQYLPLFLICSILLLSSPFPAIPIVLLCIFSIIIDKRNWIKENIISLKNNLFFNIENLASILIALSIYFYYKSNMSASNYGIFSCSMVIIPFIYFFIGCFGIYFIFAPKKVIKNPYCLFLIFITFILSFIQIGYWYDFSYRIWYPLSFMTMILVLECLIDVNFSKISKFVFIILLLSSGLIVLIDFYSIIKHIISGEPSRRWDYFSTMLDKTNNSCYQNFAGSTDAFYYQHLAPHRGVLPELEEKSENNAEKNEK